MGDTISSDQQNTKEDYMWEAPEDTVTLTSKPTYIFDKCCSDYNKAILFGDCVIGTYKGEACIAKIKYLKNVEFVKLVPCSPYTEIKRELYTNGMIHVTESLPIDKLFQLVNMMK